MAGSIEEVLADANFLKLVATGTSSEEFTKLIEDHVPGYLQRKRLLDAMKDLLKRVEDVEGKLSVMKSVGKAKQLSNDEILLSKGHDMYDLRDKVQILSGQAQAQIDEGRLSAEERPLVLEQLHARKNAAKAAGKSANLLEKLDHMIDAVAKLKKPITLDVPNLVDIHLLSKELDYIYLLEGRPAKTITVEEKESMKRKDKATADLAELRKKSRMWFELESEFAPRLAKSLVVHAKWVEEEKKKAEERAAEEKRLEAERKLEAKRQEKLAKEEAHHQMLMQKLEEKKKADELKPKKEVVKEAKKEKVRSHQMNPHELFVAPIHPSEREDPVVPEEPWEEEAWEEAPAAAPAKAAEQPKTSPAMKPAPAPEPKKVEKPKAPPKPKAVLENKWGAPAALPDDVAAAVAEADADESALPSLGDALIKEAPAKIQKAPAAPKKKGKAKFTKMSMSDLGFDDNNPNKPVIANAWATEK